MIVGPFLSFRLLACRSFVRHLSLACPMLRRTPPWRLVALVEWQPPAGYAACRICCHLPRGSRPGIRWPH